MTEPNIEALRFDPDAGAPHDLPSVTQLVEAVREWIESDLADELVGRTRFHARVAANMLAIVERELDLGVTHGGQHAARLAALGVGDEHELAAGIRAGDFDERAEELHAALRETVRCKLEVANPRYLQQP